MTKIKLFTSILMILLLTGLCCYAQDRQYIPLKQTWRFKEGIIEGAQKTDFNDSEWDEIKLPHTWNTDLIKDRGYYKGAAWYRFTLPITPEMMGKRLFLQFEGALTTADVFLNGEKVGRHEGGYSAFSFEITSIVNWNSRNVLAVQVDNSDNKDVVPVGDRLFTRFGGLYRPAWLLVTDKVCITPLDYASPGLYIRQEQVTDKRAELAITTKVSNGSKEAEELTVLTTIFDTDGQQVARTSNDMLISSGQTAPLVQKLSLDEFRLWDGRKNPYLYRVTVQLTKQGKTMDQVSQPLGLRYFHVDKDKGLFLNGKYLDLYGVSRHQEWEHEGSALTDEHHKEDIDLIMELGARGVRLAHYQQAETVYSLCDRNGLIVWTEIPVTPPYQKDNPKFLANAKQQLIELIRQNYNHPSILFWGLYNEVNIPEADVQELYGLAKAEDPTRLVTAASSNGTLKTRHKITDLICWNRYPMWYGGGNISVWADNLKRKNPELKLGVSEYGADGCVNQHQQNPKRPDPVNGRFYPEEYQSIVHEKLWPELKERPYLWSKFIWNMFDFSWPGVARGYRINMNNKGLITYDRKVKKDAFFYYKANWSEEPVLYITSRRHVERDEPVTNVKVYSNYDNLQLTLNNKEYGTTIGSNGIFVWYDLILAEGPNKITVTGTRDGIVFSDSCEWTYHQETKQENSLIKNWLLHFLKVFRRKGSGSDL